MGKGRYLYDNLITAGSMLTASSIWAGTVGSPLKEGTGAGTMTPSGAYAGTDDRLYTVEVDGAGDIGAATFKWRKNASIGWEAAAVAPRASSVTLEDGVLVRFGSGTGTDFNLGDKWTFKATRFFSPAKTIDRDPDIPWRSALFIHRPALADVNVEVYDASAPGFTDKTPEAFSEAGSTTGPIWADAAGGDTVYVGCRVPFDRIAVDVRTAAAGAGALTVERHNGTAWTAVNGLTDGTASDGNTFARDGDVTFTIPSDWARQGEAALDADKYYVRLKPAAGPTTAPDCERLAPAYLPETLTIDAGTAISPTVLVLHAHNISASSTVIQLLGNSSNEWGSPAFTRNLTHAADTIGAFISGQSCRYWQIRVADKSGAEGRLEIGEVFLGTHFEPAKNYVLDFEESQEADEDDQRTAAGAPRPILRNRARIFDLPYRLLDSSDRTGFRRLYEAVKDRSAVKSNPFFFMPDSALPSETYLVHWVGPLRFRHRSSSFADLQVELEERPMSSF